MEDRNDSCNITWVYVTSLAIIVSEHVTFVDAWVRFPIVLDHVFDRSTHGTYVNDNTSRSYNTVTCYVVQGETQLTFLLNDR